MTREEIASGVNFNNVREARLLRGTNNYRLRARLPGDRVVELPFFEETVALTSWTRAGEHLVDRCAHRLDPVREETPDAQYPVHPELLDLCVTQD
mgnify:CR=1 FL=1